MGKNLVDVDLGDLATAIDTGWGHTCALLRSGELKCWGWNGNGQLGVGDRTDRGDKPIHLGNFEAARVGTGRTVRQFSCGYAHTCAILDNDELKCWGANGQGELGYANTRGGYGYDPGMTGDNLPAVDLGPGQVATQVSAGKHYTCALLRGNSVKCWGEGALGQTGLNTIASVGNAAWSMGSNLSEVQLPKSTDLVAVAACEGFTCVIEDEDVYCWGQNGDGELGVGDAINRGDGLISAANLPGGLKKALLGRKDTDAVGVGSSHTCVLFDAGNVRCFGSGFFGQLGQDSTVYYGQTVTSMQVLDDIDFGGVIVTDLGVGYDHNCVVLASQLKCWGLGGHGRLGYGSNSNIGGVLNDMTTLGYVDIGQTCTASPTQAPSAAPSSPPTRLPTSSPSAPPSVSPTSSPTGNPSTAPTSPPTTIPTVGPTAAPTAGPTAVPTSGPTVGPTAMPSVAPSIHPSGPPTTTPSTRPTDRPSGGPSSTPSAPPSGRPTSRPSAQPSGRPSAQPSTQPSSRPSAPPSSRPSAPPSAPPSSRPSAPPSSRPSGRPSAKPSSRPSGRPTTAPSALPSTAPTESPLLPSLRPSRAPSTLPSLPPSTGQTQQPTELPTGGPRVRPTESPATLAPAAAATAPSTAPSRGPTSPPKEREHSPAIAVSQISAVSEAALAATMDAAFATQAVRLGLLAANCDDELSFLVHPTGVEISGFKKPAHAGCVILGLSMLTGLVLLHGAASHVVALLPNFKRSIDAEGVVRFPGGSITLCVMLCQGIGFASGGLIPEGGKDTVVGVLGVLATAGLPPVVLWCVRLSRYAAYKLDPEVQACGRMLHGRGEWCTREKQVVLRFGMLFKAMRPGLVHAAAIETAIAVSTSIGAGLAGSSCTGCGARRVVDGVGALAMVVVVLLHRPYSRLLRIPLLLVANSLAVIAAAAFAHGYLTDCSADNDGTSGALSGHVFGAACVVGVAGALFLAMATDLVSTTVSIVRRRRARIARLLGEIEPVFASGVVQEPVLHDGLQRAWQKSPPPAAFRKLYSGRDAVNIHEFLEQEHNFWGGTPVDALDAASSLTPLTQPFVSPLPATPRVLSSSEALIGFPSSPLPNPSFRRTPGARGTRAGTVRGSPPQLHLQDSRSRRMRRPVVSPSSRRPPLSGSSAAIDYAASFRSLEDSLNQASVRTIGARLPRARANGAASRIGSSSLTAGYNNSV